MREHIIKVHEKPNKVVARQKSKTVWVAVGYFLGERIEVAAATESSVLAAWHEAARSRGTR